MITQSSVHPPGKDVPPPAEGKGKVTKMAVASSDGASRTTDSDVRMKKFDVAHYCQKDLLLRDNQISDLEIQLCDISDGNVTSWYNPYVRMGSTT